MPTSLPAVGAEASSLKVTWASGATWRMPSRMVLPGMVSPDRPCQATVQPPAEPPPDSSDPSRQVAISDGSPETAPRSG
jgi:hypothetical protein